VIEQVTPDGTVLLTPDVAKRVFTGFVLPWRARYVNAEGEVIFEEVLRSRNDFAGMRERAKESLRIARGETMAEAAEREAVGRALGKEKVEELKARLREANK